MPPFVALPSPHRRFPVFHWLFAHHPASRGVVVYERFSVYAVTAFFAIGSDFIDSRRNKAFVLRGALIIFL